MLKKLTYFLRNLQTSQVNNLRILGNKKAKLWEMWEIIFEINLLICHSKLFAVLYSPFWYFLRHPDIQKQKLGCKWVCKTKKWLTIILMNFLKQPVIKQSPTFLSFSFLTDRCISVFSLSLSKRLQILKNW